MKWSSSYLPKNLSQFDFAFNKLLCWANFIFYLLFLQKVASFAFLGHTFAVLIPFSALVCEEMHAEWPFCLFTPGEFRSMCCKNSLDFPILIFFFFFFPLQKKNGKFWSVVLFLIATETTRKMVNLQKPNLNFVKRRNGGFSIYLLEWQSAVGQGFWHSVTPCNLLHRPGPDPKIVNVMAPTPDWPISRLPGLDRTKPFYHQPQINQFQTTTNLRVHPEME